MKLKLRIFSLIGLLCTLNQPVLAQKTHPIYSLEDRLMNGDKEALVEIAPYFDNKEHITEFLGTHALQATLSSVARRIVEENSSFTEIEYQLTDTCTWKGFSRFLEVNNSRIHFSRLIDAFICSPLELRTVRFEARGIAMEKKKQLKTRSQELLASGWVHANKLDSFLKNKDPYALVLIASGLCKARNRWNRYPNQENEYLDLLCLLTETEIGVENEFGKLSWQISMDYRATSRYNLLQFYLGHYKEYRWDDGLGIFIHPGRYPTQPSAVDNEQAAWLTTTRIVIFSPHEP